MSKVTFQWQGVEELKKNFEKVGVAIDDKDPELKAVLLKPAQAMRDNAKSLAPKKTGNLAAAIYASVGGAKQRGVLMGVRIRKAPYAYFVETGTSKMPAQPYFRPALLRMAGTFVNDIQPGVKQFIEKTSAKNAYHPPK
jgi:HK97 gp10 family phage protein